MTDFMKYDPSKRPSASQALQYPYFQVGNMGVPRSPLTSALPQPSSHTKEDKKKKKAPQQEYNKGLPSLNQPKYGGSHNQAGKTTGSDGLPPLNANKQGSFVRNARYYPGVNPQAQKQPQAQNASYRGGRNSPYSGSPDHGGQGHLPSIPRPAGRISPVQSKLPPLQGGFGGGGAGGQWGRKY
mmetsp:Transcript_35374/g.92014  ORF Transcript_35374/g.92014 Transcript_35374/m.92014 type:complete len:183 (-) Transcript_35374:1319-1867(-)